MYYLTSWTGNETALNFLYDAIVQFGKNLNWNFVIFNGFFAFVATFLILITILKQSKYPSLVLSFWYIFPFLDNIIQKRAYYALGIIIVTLPLLFSKNHKWAKLVFFELIILLSLQIHSFAIYYFTLPFFLLLDISWQKRIAIFFVVFGLVFKNILQMITSFIFGNQDKLNAKASLYFDTLAQNGSLLHTLFWLFWQILLLSIIIYIYKRDIKNQKLKVILSMNWWGLTLIPLYSFDPVFTRVFRAVLLFNYIEIANFLSKSREEKKWSDKLIVLIAQLGFLFISFYFFDFNSRLGIQEMIYSIFENNWLLNI